MEETSSIAHNWLYAFLPSSETVHYGDIEDTIESFFLLGYCKQCDTSVAMKLEKGKVKPVFTKMGIPKYGCPNDRE